MNIDPNIPLPLSRNKSQECVGPSENPETPSQDGHKDMISPEHNKKNLPLSDDPINRVDSVRWLPVTNRQYKTHSNSQSNTTSAIKTAMRHDSKANSKAAGKTECSHKVNTI